MEENTSTENTDKLFKHQMELLKLELTLIDNCIRQYDEITKSVKNWSIVAWTGSVGIALATPELRSFVGLSGLLPLLFWVLDGAYRRIQRKFIVRVQQISEFINSESFKRCAASGTDIDFPLLKMRVDSGPKTRLPEVMLFGTVSYLYLGLAAVSVAIWFFVG